MALISNLRVLDGLKGSSLVLPMLIGPHDACAYALSWTMGTMLAV